eukprot:5053462-Heterocapsa_arctica.AAC.1
MNGAVTRRYRTHMPTRHVHDICAHVVAARAETPMSAENTPLCVSLCPSLQQAVLLSTRPMLVFESLSSQVFV